MDKVRLHNAVEALKRGRARIEKPNGWTQYAFARTALGASVPCDYNAAVSYCARGALHCERVAGAEPGICIAAWDANKLLEEGLAGVIERLASHGVTGEDFRPLADQGVTFWNDTHGRTVEQVLYLYDAAIELGEARLAAAVA